MAQVVFNYGNFIARYPEFASANPAQIAALFPEACLYCSNADCSPIQNLDRRAIYLNMLVAHIAFLGGLLSADGQPRPVGRVSQAAEGSVSAGFEFISNATPGTGPWFNQSQYGAAFWQATSSKRSFFYVPQPTCY